ncbi:MAG: DUF4347 domain-containing protein, partial [Planctomycetaceae bacterium]|nr:DUF4347 domain-containing protein [Planctomycetaceae bacterium]
MMSSTNFSGKNRRLLRSKRLHEQLEDRLLFDAVPDGLLPQFDGPLEDPLTPAVEDVAVAQNPATDLAEHVQQEQRTELVFVDKRVGHYEELVPDLLQDETLEVHFLNRNGDGLAQIQAAIAGRTDIDALHIISHATPGELLLGTSRLNLETMSGEYREALAAIGTSLSSDADILLYGCRFAEGDEGSLAVEALSLATGADVAASSDDTGHASRGGDWILEVQHGLVETGIVVAAPTQENYQGILASDGDLQVEVIAAPNFVVDSNKPEEGPSAAYIGVKITNTGADTLSDVFVYAGDHANGRIGLYPVLSNPTVGGTSYVGDLSLQHEGGPHDANRFIGDLAAGETRVEYFLVSYPTTDDNGNSLAGATSDPNDDVSLNYDIWVTAEDTVDGSLEAVTNGTATLRSEISAQANKIWPNTTSKVPQNYLTAFEEQLGWRPDKNAITPGAEVQLQGIWYDLGRVVGGLDADGNLIPDHDIWMQPVGNAEIFEAEDFRLVKTYGVLVVKLNDGTEQIIAFEDQLYHKDLPANNTGVVGLVFYEYVATGSLTQASLSPYQEAASGNGNLKYNGDSGRSGGTFTVETPEVDLVKDALNATTETPITTIQAGGTIEYSLQATNTSTTAALGSPQY